MSKERITIQYNGEYPNLCSGQLVVTIGDKKWAFPDYCLRSGGSVHFDADWNEVIGSGEWTIDKFPKGFPKEYKQTVIDRVNEEIPHGCCGGCV